MTPARLAHQLTDRGQPETGDIEDLFERLVSAATESYASAY